MIELACGDVVATVSPADGGRVASLTVGTTDLLVRGDSSHDPMSWGSYPMVPWAGRVRDAALLWEDGVVRLPVNMPPNSIHGTGFTTRWDVLDDGLDHCELQCALDWPLGGTAHQHVQLTPGGLVCVLTVVAGHRRMPAVIGWHPWFVKPVDDRLRFGSMYERGADGLPTGRLLEPTPRPWDDCLVRPDPPLQLRYPNLTVSIASDADHWVVYDEPAHATCVEPQSAPPDAFGLGLAPTLAPGEMLQRTMTITWA